MAHIAELLEGDISAAELDEVINGAQEVELIRQATAEQSGRLLAELHRRGLSWPEIARRTGIPQSTAHWRAQDYL